MSEKSLSKVELEKFAVRPFADYMTWQVKHDRRGAEKEAIALLLDVLSVASQKSSENCAVNDSMVETITSLVDKRIPYSEMDAKEKREYMRNVGRLLINDGKFAAEVLNKFIEKSGKDQNRIDMLSNEKDKLIGFAEFFYKNAPLTIGHRNEKKLTVSLRGSQE